MQINKWRYLDAAKSKEAILLDRHTGHVIAQPLSTAICQRDLPVRIVYVDAFGRADRPQVVDGAHALPHGQVLRAAGEHRVLQVLQRGRLVGGRALGRAGGVGRGRGPGGIGGNGCGR